MAIPALIYLYLFIDSIAEAIATPALGPSLLIAPAIAFTCKEIPPPQTLLAISILSCITCPRLPVRIRDDLSKSFYTSIYKMHPPIPV